MKAFRVSAKHLGNVVLLNHSTCLVSCETNCNRSNTTDYIDGKSDQISLPNTIHNLKNCRCRIIGGSCAEVIDNNFFCS